MITQEQAAAAFARWEELYREDPESFLTEGEVAALEVAPLSDRRAIYFIAMLRLIAEQE